MGLIYNELLPMAKRIPGKKKLYHCGDVFDSRSTLNTLVAKTVRQAFIDMAEVFDEIVVIAGNHDFYSPTDDSVDSVTLVLSNIDKVRIVTDEMVVTGTDMFVPWFKWFEVEEMRSMIDKHHPKAVWCHTDLAAMTTEQQEMLQGVKVFSGHIHYPSRKGDLLTMGATYALTFADHDADRGWYVVDAATYKWRFYPSATSIRFWRFKNDEMFDKLDECVRPCDYVEIYIDKSLMLNEKYVNRIKEVATKVRNTVVVPSTDIVMESQEVNLSSYNIEELCRNNIPSSLKSMFEEVVAIVKSKNAY
jgi:DNA repair exonuclease SbcCD nuclease subunit